MGWGRDNKDSIKGKDVKGKRRKDFSTLVMGFPAMSLELEKPKTEEKK